MATIVKDLGAVTAYAYAVEKGYTGTEDEFAELMASYADVAEQAAESAAQAGASATEAEQAKVNAALSASAAATSASTASTKASEAASSASSAAGSANTATAKANEASASATNAASSASAAATSATNAGASATAAASSATAASNAQTAAETAQGKAEDAQTAAEDAAEQAGIYAAGYLKAFPVDTASGAVANFPDGADELPVKDLTVAIEPVQSGSGDPAPDNVRPISGWTGANIHVSPTTDATDGTTYSIAFPSEAGTVYGGTLDVTTGKLTVDRAMVDLGTRNWVNATAAGYTRFWACITDIERISSANVLAPMLCSAYKIETANNTYTGKQGISLQPNADTVYVYDAQRESMTTADFKAAMSGVQLCYSLATPIVYDLDPVAVTTLLGTNNVWGDTGNSNVEYRADPTLYIDKKIAALAAAMN